MVSKTKESVHDDAGGAEQTAWSGAGHTSESAQNGAEAEPLLQGTEETELPGNPEHACVCSSLVEEEKCLNGWPGFSLMGKVRAQV